MIYTVTLNPAIDYIMFTANVPDGGLVRSEKEEYFAGGKGINVSRVLKELGVPSTALGFVAGFTGDAIEAALKNDGIPAGFVHLKNGFTRINVKLKSTKESEINGAGPEITHDDAVELLKKIKGMTPCDTLIISGSAPKKSPPTLYRELISTARGLGVRVIADISGKELTGLLSFEPFLIKPNHHELGELFGCEITSPDMAAQYARKLKDMGAVNVLVSLSSDGALLIDGNGSLHRGAAPKGTLVNSVGSGDSMVAGFVAGYDETGDYSQALKLGIAAGSATAFSHDLAAGNDIRALYNTL